MILLSPLYSNNMPCPEKSFTRPATFLINIIRAAVIFLLIHILLISNQGFLFAEEKVERENITMKVVAVNPSEDQDKTIPVKIYLPEEVTPKDIVNTRDLKIEYDSDKSMYYAYNDSIMLKPKEMKVFEVEVKDVWFVPSDEIDTLKSQTELIMTRLKGTDYFDTAKKLEDAIYRALDTVVLTQNDLTVSRRQHIGVYRNNLKIIDQVEDNIARLEKILVTAGGPAAPEMLADTKIKSDSPTKTMTWIVIFSIIVFSALLAGVLFFTWHRQAKITREEILAAKKAAFPGSKDEGRTKPS